MGGKKKGKESSSDDKKDDEKDKKKDGDKGKKKDADKKPGKSDDASKGDKLKGKQSTKNSSLIQEEPQQTEQLLKHKTSLLRAKHLSQLKSSAKPGDDDESD